MPRPTLGVQNMKRKARKALSNLTETTDTKLYPAVNVRLNNAQETMLEVVSTRLNANNDSHAIRMLIERAFEEIVNGRFK